MALTPVAIRSNPNDRSQGYVLNGNGRIDAFGGAPPVTGWQGWYDRLDLPVAVDLHIIDWDEPAGYIFDFQGGFIPFGGAPVITTTVDGATVNLNGLPYVGYRRYGSWSWDPAGSGQGYAVDVYGEILAFGGAPAPPRTGPRWAYPAVRAFAMGWGATKRALTLDYSGGLHGDFNPVTINSAPYWPFMDVAWDLEITEWSATPKGYVLDHNRRVWPVNGAPDAFGYPYTPSYVGRLLEVLSPADPLRLRQVDALGAHYEWTASTPPSITIVSPAAEVADTTRPTLAWVFSDPQSESQKAYEWLIFTEAFAASHTMTDPAVHAASAVASGSGIDRTVRSVTVPLDLANGDYRGYARVQDTADLWSAWDAQSWEQDVPLPAAPTGLTATADPASFAVALSVTATPGVADLVRFEFSEDGEATWATVAGAGAVELAATTVATDRFPGQGVERTYRAVAYSLNPAVASSPSNTDTATLQSRVHLLHSVDDPTIGGVVPAVDPSEWTRPVSAGVFEGLGAEYPTVVTDGRPKARRMNLRLITHNRAEWLTVKALGEADSVLVYRDPFGDVVFCRLISDWRRTQLPAAPLLGETTPLRHMHSTELPLIEVRPPGSV